MLHINRSYLNKRKGFEKQQEGCKKKRNALIHHVAVMLCECHVNVIQFVMARKNDSRTSEKEREEQ